MIIRLFKPSIGNEEINSIKKVFKKSWLGYGPRVNEFEKKWSKFINSKYSVGVNSCTAALHVSLKVNNFKKSKKVLVPAITFSATAAAVLYCDLIPVFVDVNKDTLVIDFEDLKKKYTKDCVAVIPVHLGGNPCEMEKIMPWARKKKITVIEDCAETAGGTYKGKKLGTWGDFGCFSFEEKKIMTTGDGGMICTNDKEKYKKIKKVSFHGWNKDPWSKHKNTIKKNLKESWKYSIDTLGFKYNMNDLMASIGLVQLKKLKFFNRKREKILKKYIEGIKNCKNIKLGFEYELKNSSYWLFVIRCKKRDQLIDYLKMKGISSSVHFEPLPLQPLYKKYKSTIPNAKKVWLEIISLPLFTDLNLSQINYIIKIIKKFDKDYDKY